MTSTDDSRCPIALIPFANTAPFAELGEPDGCRFVEMTPRDSVQGLLNADVYAALAPVGSLAVLGELVEPVGHLGIAAGEQCGSVLFFAGLPLDQFTPACRIRLTKQSATSVRLLFLLIGYAGGFDKLPRPAAPGERVDGELEIGDDALRRLTAELDGGDTSHIIDLATAWYERHQLPFVFARWVARRDMPAAARQGLAAWLEEFLAREAELVKAAAQREARRLGLTTEAMHAYLCGLRRVLGDAELAGQALFMRELAAHPEVEGALT